MTAYYPGDRVAGYPTRAGVPRRMSQGTVLDVGDLGGQEVIYVCWDGSVAPRDAREQRWRDTVVPGAVGPVVSR